MTNHETIAEAMRSQRGQVLTTSQIRNIVVRAFPQSNPRSLLPNDHGAGSKSCCWCVGTREQIFDPIRRGLYRVLERPDDVHGDRRINYRCGPTQQAAGAPKRVRSQVISGPALWNRVTRHLDAFLPHWRHRIRELGQVDAIQKRSNGGLWSDDEIFEGITLAVLSNSIDWSKIEGLRPQLRSVFLGFNPSLFAQLSDKDVDGFVKWFAGHDAPLPYRGRNLRRLKRTANQLCRLIRQHACLESFLTRLFTTNDADPKRLAMALGSAGSIHKLAGLGVPLAAEALKNVGYDVAKPDRHINRALGCFGMVEFPRWHDRGGRNTPPQPTLAELTTVMQVIETLSADARQTATFVDNAIWLLCAKSGLWMRNSDLVQLGR